MLLFDIFQPLSHTGSVEVDESVDPTGLLVIRLSVFVKLNSALETNVLHHSSFMIEAEGQLFLHTAQVGWDHLCALINDIIIYLLVLSLSNRNICVIKTVRND